MSIFRTLNPYLTPKWPNKIFLNVQPAGDILHPSVTIKVLNRSHKSFTTHCRPIFHLKTRSESHIIFLSWPPFLLAKRNLSSLLLAYGSSKRFGRSIGGIGGRCRPRRVRCIATSAVNFSDEDIV